MKHAITQQRKFTFNELPISTIENLTHENDKSVAKAVGSLIFPHSPFNSKNMDSVQRDEYAKRLYLDGILLGDTLK